MSRERYVVMVDRFMSGWGLAKGGRSFFVVRCHNEDQVKRILAAARAREEMDLIRVTDRLPKTRPGEHVAVRDWSEVGEVWREGRT